MKSHNPYVAKLEKAQARLDRLEAKQRHYDAIAIPGTFVTGRSGISASYKKRLDRQIERTIDLAGLLVKQRRLVAQLAQSVEMYDRGEINAQGRSVSPRKPIVRKPEPASKQVLDAEMHLTYTKMEIDGRALFHGHRLEVWIDPKWDDKKADAVGIIRQIKPDGEVVDHIAKSIQGVDLEKAAYTVMRMIQSG